MTSDQLKNLQILPEDGFRGSMLREIAYQLATQNELQRSLLLLCQRTLQIQEAVYGDRLRNAQECQVSAQPITPAEERR